MTEREWKGSLFRGLVFRSLHRRLIVYVGVYLRVRELVYSDSYRLARSERSLFCPSVPEGDRGDSEYLNNPSDFEDIYYINPVRMLTQAWLGL